MSNRKRDTYETWAASLVRRFGKRNAILMLEREMNHSRAIRIMLAVNDSWHDRAWQTPDVAVCLG